MRGLECVSHVPQEILMLSQYRPEASQLLTDFNCWSFIMSKAVCVCVRAHTHVRLVACVFVLLDRVTSLRQGH